MAGTTAVLAVVMAVLLHIVWVLDGASTVEAWSLAIPRMQRPATSGGAAAAIAPAATSTQVGATMAASVGTQPPPAPTSTDVPATPAPVATASPTRDPTPAPAAPVPPTAPQLVDVGLDPGHSDADPGAFGGGLRECDLTLPLAVRVKALLEEQGLTVTLTRSDNRPLSSMSARDPVDRVREEQEARIAAAGNVRVYVSLHHNGHPDSSLRGIETYFNASNRGEESRRLASSIQQHLIASVRSTGYGAPDRGVREDLSAGKPYGHFFSLRGGAPSVLVEAMFLTNPVEASLLAQPETLEAIARGVTGGIVEYLSGPG